jgi:choline transport protein
MGICGSIGLLGTASRMLWAFAREDGVPFSNYVSKVSKQSPAPIGLGLTDIKVESRTALPLYAIGITAFISLGLALINLGSTVTFNALTGLTVAGFYSAFMVSGTVMLYRRLTTPATDIAWGPFRLGKFGVPVTLFALMYSLIGWIFSFWPPVSEVSVQTFNWSLAVYFGVMFLAVTWWALSARKTYKGPKMEL